MNVPVNEPLLNGNEKKYLNECIDTNWISSEGPFVKMFEDKLSQKIGRRYGVAVCNGSAALELAITALNIGPGDEVILPALTIISCIAPIIRSGAKPVLVESDPNTWNMDVSAIESKINKNTKAIMIVHLYGLPVDVDPILLIAKKHNLKVIEDAAEMHGQYYKDKPCGSFGDISIFSFYPNKHITTGEGGMILTDDESINTRCRSLRDLCHKPGQRFIHEELGWNFRMTNLQAALGIAQLERLDEFVTKKRKNGQAYTQLLKNCSMVQLPLEKTDYATNIYWVFGLVLDKNVPYNAREFITKLAEEGVGARPFFWPMHKQPVFEKMGLFKNESYPIAENLGLRGFYIPSGLALTEDQIQFVVKTINKILK